MKPYAIISDTHHHDWSAFSTTTPEGINSRLNWILKETTRAATVLADQGGDKIFHAGDLFHVRGSIAPSVLVPTLDCYSDLIKKNKGMNIVVIPGNHDLENDVSSRISSAVTALEGIGVTVANDGYVDWDHNVVCVPWVKNIDDLKKRIQKQGALCGNPGIVDLIIHAPVDGVIPGLPDHGLTDSWLAKQGFKRIFAGHYHNHKDFNNGVYSIGALTHHTWSDVGTKAGFLIVTDEGVTWHKSHAPEFVDVDGAMNPSDVELMVDGNYARVKMISANNTDIEKMRKWLTDSGALGVQINATKDMATPTRTNSIKAGASLEVSVADYIKTSKFDNMAELQALCASHLADVRRTI